MIKSTRKSRFDTDEVEIVRRGDEVVLRKPPTNLAAAFELLAGLSSDFFRHGRKQPKAEKRTEL